MLQTRPPRLRRQTRLAATGNRILAAAHLSGPGTDILELQGLAGNTAVTRLLQTTAALGIQRNPDPDALPTPPAALDDPSFNAEALAHDLLRAIDQKQHSFVMDAGGHELPDKERRNIEFDKVVAALENRTSSQIAEIKRRYAEFEGHDITIDLFEGGESNRQSSLTTDQRARAAVLLRGTRGEPIPPQVMADLRTYPPQLAAQIGAAMANKSNAAAAMQQLEADAIEVHELLFDTQDESHRERLMALYRRPVQEIRAMEAFFGQHFGVATLDLAIKLRVFGVHRSRLEALRHGDWAQADAYAIEAKRREIEAINKEEKDDQALESTTIGAGLRQLREKKKAELSGSIEAILDMNRREGLADRKNMARTAGEVVAERLNKILDQHVGEGAAALRGDLATTLNGEHANIVATAADSWNTSGGASLVESAAAELVAMEKDHTTTAARIIEQLRMFRKLAEHDLLAHVLSASVSPEEKVAIDNDKESAVTGIAQKYIVEYRAAYDRQRGDGRTFEAIVHSADDADETLIGDLTVGGGRTSDVAELEQAMGNKDVDRVKQILRNQRGQQAMQALVAAYNRLGGGRDLKKELFGVLPSGEQVDPAQAAKDDLRWMTRGLLKGRDAAQVEEQLEKPNLVAPTAPSTTDPSRPPGMSADAEAAWLAKGGSGEFNATMDNRGWTGKTREWTGDPETERLLKSSNVQLAGLALQFQAARTPEQRQHLLLEIRKMRSALTGDAEAYEKDNERVLGEIRGALSFAVSIALAVAIPGAGAGLIAFIETTALNVAANVAANMVIKGGDYGWADLKADVLGGVLGAGGGKFGEELLGRVAARIAPATGKAAVGVGEKVGIQTALAKEVAQIATTGERVAIGAEEFEAREVGHEAATALTESGEAGVKSGVKPSLVETSFREAGGFFGGIYGGKLYSGDFGLSVEEVLQALAATTAGKLAHHKRAAGAEEAKAPAKTPSEQTREHEQGKQGEAPRERDEPHDREQHDEPEEHQTQDREAEPVTGGIGHSAAANTDAFGPRSPSQMLAENGVPPESAHAFQAFADEHNVVIKVRPTNTASLRVLAEGGLPKPEIVKAKTLNRTDMLIGGPPGQVGKVGFFEPKMPRQEILDVLSPEARQQVTDRYNQRLEEYQHYNEEYIQLAAEGLVRIENGVLQVADPRGAATPKAPRGPFKDVGGDHDVFDVRHSDGSPLSEPERALATTMLRSMGINVEHGFHMAWEMDSPQTYSAEADAKIQEQHTEREPLIAFVPKSQPREVFANDQVLGPERTPGSSDPHRPLKGAKFVESTPENTPGPDESGTTHGDVADSDTRQVRAARRDTPTSGPDLTSVKDVLPQMKDSSKFIDRQTAWLVEQGVIQVTVLEALPELPSVERMRRLKAQNLDPATHTIRVHPRVGEITLRIGASGHELGRRGDGEIILSEHMAPEEVMQTLRHEVSHALRPGSAGGKHRALPR